MNDQDIIRKAVELADGWSYQPIDFVWIHQHGADEAYSLEVQWVLDALAAQLVRQVDALPEPKPMIICSATACSVVHPDESYLMEGNDAGRTMNTLRAIIESGVLG